MSVIAIYNIKGGVGKTATAVNLSYLSSCDGAKTLLCDMDSQGSASYYFRIRPAKKFDTHKLLKGGEHIQRNIRGTDFLGLDLLPADFSYRNLDLALDGFEDSKLRLKKVLQPLRSEYGHIFLDCPPNITLLSENIFNAADCIIVPLIPTTLSLLALKQLLDFLTEINKRNVKVLIFFSMVEKRKKMHVEIVTKFRKKKGFLKCLIPFLADIEKMGIYRKPVTAASPRGIATAAYKSLWQEISEHIGKK